ncbi:HlyD family efflux transporter periplasmic adaptor subunit [Sphingobacterium sp.]|uniref:HlyD family efflux transporter periplasmic adaptor subunit n=1 Tax=Sphingobacterium sp. TaxID=341027 RepID=UPI002897D694|nr:HlyD family efflux transporter periplasmic adaptor subunit [Sphingobacterium sp.]
MEKVEQLIEPQNEELEEIVGRIPSFVIRRGMSILVIVAIVTLLIATNISYPEVLKGTVIFQSNEQPGKVTIRREDANQVYNLLVKKGDIVNDGDTLLVRHDVKKNLYEYVKTPMNGKIFISEGISQENTLDMIIWVVPEAKTFEIKLSYKDDKSGQVSKGQKVKMYLSEYPADKYGYIEGQVQEVYPFKLEDKNQALVRISTPKLRTSQNVDIPLRHVMNGNAEIILSNNTIYTRIFNSIFQKP